MPLFPRRKVASPPRVPNVIVAAASRVRSSEGRRLLIPKSQWQAEAWRQYDISGELRYGATWLGNSLSRCRLIASEVAENGDVQAETENAVVQGIMGGLIGSPGKQAEMLMRLGIHMTVPGDCYVVAEAAEHGGFKTWEVVSTDEITVGGQNEVLINTGDGYPRKVSTESALVIRVYRPHPRRSWEADSPTRAALPVLREMEQLTTHIFATIDSRLAGAGILMLPSELDFPNPEGNLQPGESPFLALLAEAMMASIADRGDARAVVPIVVQGPAAALGTAQWLVSPAMNLTVEAADLRDRAIRRLAIDLDMPPEVLLGMAGSNHWNAWSVEEQAIKLHIEPVMTLICSALTEGYLRPALEAAGIDPQKYVVWFDSTALVLRPDRVTDAKDMYDRGLLSAESLRKILGFAESDAPMGEELGIEKIYRLVKAAPLVVDVILPSALHALGLDKLGITKDALVEQAATPRNVPIIEANAPGGNDDPNKPNPNGGTPVVTTPPPPANKTQKSPPVAGKDGNQG